MVTPAPQTGGEKQENHNKRKTKNYSIYRQEDLAPSLTLSSLSSRDDLLSKLLVQISKSFQPDNTSVVPGTRNRSFNPWKAAIPGRNSLSGLGKESFWPFATKNSVNCHYKKFLESARSWAITQFPLYRHHTLPHAPVSGESQWPGWNGMSRTEGEAARASLQPRITRPIIKQDIPGFYLLWSSSWCWFRDGKASLLLMAELPL